MTRAARSPHFTAEHDHFRKTVRDFLETEVAPHADAWEEARRIPREIWRRMGEQGFLGINLPEAHGGTGADVFFGIAFLEELPRSRMGGFCAAVTVQEFIATGAIVRHGTEDLKRRYLAPSIEGRKVGAIAISEPDTGSDVAAIRTTAVRDGDWFVLNGAKTWITNGVEGDFYVVAAKTSKDAGAGGISLLAMDADLPGIRTSKLRKMGWHSSDTAEIVFENVRVPAADVVGKVDRGFLYIMETFALERLAAAATGIGSCDLALELTLRYMSERKAFGRTLDRFQALRHRLADLLTEVEAARQLVYHTAWLYQTGQPCVRESSMAKLLASELANKVVDACLQFHGGYGYVEEYPMARFYRDARVGTIVAGTSEIMREIIAKIDIDGVPLGTIAAPDDDEAPAPPSAPTPPSQPTPQPTPPPAPALPTNLTELFAGLPARLREDKTAGLKAAFHFRFPGSSTPEWTVTVDGPACTATQGLHGEAVCEVTTAEDVYLGIETGKENPQMAFLMGKVQVSNVNELLRFMKVFRPLA